MHDRMSLWVKHGLESPSFSFTRMSKFWFSRAHPRYFFTSERQRWKRKNVGTWWTKRGTASLFKGDKYKRCISQCHKGRKKSGFISLKKKKKWGRGSGYSFNEKNIETTCTSAHTFNSPVRFPSVSFNGSFHNHERKREGEELTGRWHHSDIRERQPLARCWQRAGTLAQTIISDIYTSLDRCRISYRAKQAAPFLCHVHFMKWSHSPSCCIWEYRFRPRVCA